MTSHQRWGNSLATLLVVADLYAERGTTEGREDRPSLSTRVQWLLSPWVVLTVA